MTTATELRKLKVTELREKLSEKGLDTKGVKEDLIGRLLGAFENKGTDKGAEESPREEGAEVAQLETGDGKSEQAVENKIVVSSEKPILTEVEKQKLRAERFGLLSTPASGGKEKKQGEGAIGGLGMFNPGEEFERRKKRAERFGLPMPTLKSEEDARKKARAERFGIEVPLSKEEIEAKKHARAARFGIQDPKAIPEEVARKKVERAKRFAA